MVAFLTPTRPDQVITGLGGHGVTAVYEGQAPGPTVLFQPAEENGAGAAAVIADPKFAGIKPDWSFALHNMPGIRLGHVALDEGPVNCASRGLRIVLTGKTSHASVPEAGVSPAVTLSRLIPGFNALGPGGALAKGFQLGHHHPRAHGRASLRHRAR